MFFKTTPSETTLVSPDLTFIFDAYGKVKREHIPTTPIQMANGLPVRVLSVLTQGTNTEIAVFDENDNMTVLIPQNPMTA